jgi:hypothetical protein
MGFANMVTSYEPFKELPQGSESWPLLPPGFDRGQSSSEAPPEDVFGPMRNSMGKATVASVINENPEVYDKWFMDSGASHHFTNVRQYLHNYEPDTRDVYVKVANKQVVKREGVGSILVNTCVEGVTYRKEIRGVWYVPSFAHSLVSMQQLKRTGNWYVSGKNGDMNDYYFDSSDRLWLVSKLDGQLNSPDWGLLMAPTVPKSYSNPSYHEDDEVELVSSQLAKGVGNYSSSNHATDNESPSLWHQRLGHVNIHGLQQLVAQSRIKGINVPPRHFRKKCSSKCEVCIMAKHNRSAFRSRRNRATEPLAVLHSDVCGPYPIVSMGGGLYVVTLLDEATGYCGAAILRKKSDAPSQLMKMINEWENLLGMKCKMLFTDRGTGG